MAREISVVIIEDSKIHSEWFSEKFSENESFNVCSVESSGHSGISSVKLYQPNLVLLDFQLPDVTGLEVAKRIKNYSREAKIFMISSHTEMVIIERVILDKNINGIAIKGSEYFEDSFLHSMTSVANGETFIDPSLLKTIRNSGKSKGISSLTRREFEVFIQVASGKSDDEISSDLYVDVLHVKNLKSRIAKKVKGNKFDRLSEKLMQNLV